MGDRVYTGKERRGGPRFPLDTPVKLTVAGDATYDAVGNDFNDFSVRLTLDRAIPEGRAVILHATDGTGREVEMAGIVTRVMKGEESVEIVVTHGS